MKSTRSTWQTDEISALVERYQRPLLAYASQLFGGDWQAAQDAVQETFLRLCREDPDKIKSRVAAWLFSVCRSRVIDMQRTRKPVPMDASTQTIPDPSPDVATMVSADEEKIQLESLVEQLTPRQQEVVRLRMQAGLSYREIAEVTGLSVSNVGFHLHEAVKSLHFRLAPH